MSATVSRRQLFALALGAAALPLVAAERLRMGHPEVETIDIKDLESAAVGLYLLTKRREPRLQTVYDISDGGWARWYFTGAVFCRIRDSPELPAGVVSSFRRQSDGLAVIFTEESIVLPRAITYPPLFDSRH